MKHRAFTSALLPVILFAFGTLYCLYYGRIGYMALDHSHVFDGGWRMLCGQMPFRDFTLANTIMPVVMQPVFFKLFGINWFALCLHAAVMNGLFCILVFYFLKLFCRTNGLALFYALLSGVVFYTPFGVPVQDQHAYFFTFLLIFMAFSAAKSTRPGLKMALLAGLPAIAVLAYLSKQIPTIFGIFFVYAVLAITERKSYQRLISSTLIGTGAVVAGFAILYYTVGLDSELIRTYYVNLPLETGGERIEKFVSYNFIKTIRYMRLRWPLFFPFAVVTIVFLAGLLSMAWNWLKRDSKQARISEAMRAWRLPILAQALLLICLVFASLTFNQIENCVPLIFVALGLLHTFFLARAQRDVRIPRSSEVIAQKRFSLFISTAFLAGSLFCAVYFDRRVNKTRMVNDLIYKAEAADAGPTNVKGLEFMIWAVPDNYPCTPADFTRFINFFSSHDGNFFLIGDSSILYALTNRPSMNPVLWFHPGETLPYPHSPYFTDYQSRQIKALIEHKVKYIVLEYFSYRKGAQHTTWLGVSLAYFPALEKLVQAHETGRQSFGPFTIIELDKPIGAQAAEKVGITL